jgi:hypothetical protein
MSVPLEELLKMVEALRARGPNPRPPTPAEVQELLRILFGTFFSQPPPAPSRPSRNIEWRNVLKLGDGEVTADKINDRFRELAKQLHPDVGGNKEAFIELVAAREAALRACA